jgi:hypothetical protein
MNVGIIVISFLCFVYNQYSHGKVEHMESITTKICSYKAKDILSLFLFYQFAPLTISPLG